ncbi:MAG: heavy-metal-associated domain-containing protein [Ruminococcus sp.]|jgi:copper chaperone
MVNVIVVIILLILIGGAVAYLIKAKRSGVKCVGCPAGGSCSSSKKPARKKLDAPVIGKKTIEISGMHCAHCVTSVTEGLNQIEGVRAEVDLAKNKAVVSFDREIQDEVLKNAVEKAGFSVVSIRP